MASVPALDLLNFEATFERVLEIFDLILLENSLAFGGVVALEAPGTETFSTDATSLSSAKSTVRSVLFCPVCSLSAWSAVFRIDFGASCVFETCVLLDTDSISEAKGSVALAFSRATVSYTHLTLPTIA